MVTIDGSKLREAYDVDLEALKTKATATKSDGNGHTLYTIPLKEVVNAIAGGEVCTNSMLVVGALLQKCCKIAEVE